MFFSHPGIENCQIVDNFVHLAAFKIYFPCSGKRTGEVKLFIDIQFFGLSSKKQRGLRPIHIPLKRKCVKGNVNRNFPFTMFRVHFTSPLHYFCLIQTLSFTFRLHYFCLIQTLSDKYKRCQIAVVIMILDFIFHISYFICLGRVALQPKLFFKGPSN